MVEDRGTLVTVGSVPLGATRFTISDAPHAILARALDVQRRAAETEPHRESDARRALARWLNDRLARAASGAGDASSRQRRALLSRVDAIVARARSHTRAAIAERAIRLRALIENAVGAGIERSFAKLWSAEPGDDDLWLDKCERLLANASGPRAPNAGKPSGVRALLLLRERGGGDNALEAQRSQVKLAGHSLGVS